MNHDEHPRKNDVALLAFLAVILVILVAVIVAIALLIPEWVQ